MLGPGREKLNPWLPAEVSGRLAVCPNWNTFEGILDCCGSCCDWELPPIESGFPPIMLVPLRDDCELPPTVPAPAENLKTLLLLEEVLGIPRVMLLLGKDWLLPIWNWNGCPEADPAADDPATTNRELNLCQMHLINYNYRVA